jgi:hypothetical protein
VNKLDGLDNRYWDFYIEGYPITLHLQHYLGISLYATLEGASIDQLAEVVERISRQLRQKIGKS